MIRPSSFPPATPIRCFGRIHDGLPYATASPTQRCGARKNERLLHFALSSVSYILSWRPSAAAYLWCLVLGAAPRCLHRISRSLQLSFCLGVSTPTWSWPPSFLGRGHQLSGPNDGCGECGFYVMHIAVCRRVCPEVPSNCCGHLLSKLGISHQAPTVHWRLS